ncbi:hypothetical protein OIU77_008956 [Salix suchowensis]|uniref:Leucine-rich repeat-containing N-terminal plant-type domain-containing protein n=1 Tax=Salix suchowensis TaxID=1278906 RepID=A0ABQ9ADX7_9ROSI|nr:hypothetical protein OIU77_008956 [Salix suchowensis]
MSMKGIGGKVDHWGLLGSRFGLVHWDGCLKLLHLDDFLALSAVQQYRAASLLSLWSSCYAPWQAVSTPDPIPSSSGTCILNLSFYSFPVPVNLVSLIHQSIWSTDQVEDQLLLSLSSIGFKASSLGFDFKWGLDVRFVACFLCSSWGLKTIAQSCDPNDSLALKEFAGNLTDGSIITSWSSKSDCCQWDGVVCGSNINGSVHRRVTMLILSKKGLQGLIPRSLGYLDQLKSLDLSCNHLQGGLPSELSSLKWMEVLDLSHNLLSGPVSGVLSGLISIQSLNISSNLFKEDMFELGGYPNLVVFNISNNSFSGPVTSQICSSSKGIQILDLSMNHLVGNLAGLYNCSKSLQQLHLGSNSLSGSLPDFIYSTLALQHFSISNNNFSGRLSKELSKLSSLKTLVVYGNQFSGHMPRCIWQPYTSRAF